jgi:GDP-L-fucose synthase
MSTLAGKRIVVTGGGGFLGSHVVERLAAGGCIRVTAPRRRDYDLTDPAAVEQLFNCYRPEVLIHAAAVVGGIGANRAHPGTFFFQNLLMGIQVIEAARRHRVEKLVVLGTICAYPKFTPVPFQEAHLWDGYPEETNAPYGIAKKALLVQCQTYRQQFGLNAIYLLPVNLYGPRDNFDPDSSHVIPALIRKCLEASERDASEIVCWGDGTPTREFLYVADAAEAIVAAAELYDDAAPVNLGTGIEISIRGLVDRIAALTGFAGRVVWETAQPNGQPRRCLDVSRAKREFGFQARTSLEEGLRLTIEWYRAQRDAP